MTPTADDQSPVRSYDSNWIGGEWRAAALPNTPVESPHSGDIVAFVPDTSVDEIDLAIAAARRAFDEGPWPRLAPIERAEVLSQVADSIIQSASEFAHLLAVEAGIPVSGSASISGAVRRLTYYAELAKTYQFEEVRPSSGGDILVVREPHGVVAAIVPWNAPLGITLMKLAPALLAGCTVILKCSPEAPLACFALGEIFRDCGLPSGVLNIVAGHAAAGDQLVRHGDVDKVSFTGSTVTGRIVGEICGQRLVPCTLELGGKSAAIVLDDADPSRIVEPLVAAAMSNNGQACVLQSRILLPRGRHNEFTDALIDSVKKLRVGDPREPATQVGPLISEAHRDRVESHIRTAATAGARVALGGGRPMNMHTGWYLEPTLLVNVDNRMAIAQEEVFGPVVTLISYDDDDDAVAIANDSAFGLSGTVWTNDDARGLEVARRVVTGSTGVNRFGMDIGVPFGGVKASGIGREQGPEGLDSYTRTKAIHLAGPQ